MRVELHEGKRSMYGGSGPQFGERYGVVATEHYGDDPARCIGSSPSFILS